MDTRNIERSDLVSSSSDSDQSSSEHSLLNPNTSLDDVDGDAISLLKQIFPEESVQSLKRLHFQRIQAQAAPINPAAPALKPNANSGEGFQSNLGKRLWKELQEKADSEGKEPLTYKPVQLPESFLRLPPSVAVRRTFVDPDPTSPTKGVRYDFIADMQQRAWQEYTWLVHQLSPVLSVSLSVDFNTPSVYSAVIPRHPEVGLGIQLAEQPPSCRIRVHGFVPHPDNPCHALGIKPGDTLVGVNGSSVPFPPQGHSRIALAVDAIQQSPSPIVLHFLRKPTTQVAPPTSSSVNSRLVDEIPRSTSLLDTQNFSPINANDDAESLYSASTITTTSTIRTPPRKRAPPQISIPTTIKPIASSGPLRNTLRKAAAMAMSSDKFISTQNSMPPPVYIHPLAKALSKRGLIRGVEDEQRVTQHLAQFTQRTRQWEATNTLRIYSRNYELVPHFDPHDLPPEFAALLVMDDERDQDSFAKKPCPSSTPPLSPHSPLIPVEYQQALFGSDGEDVQGSVQNKISGQVPWEVPSNRQARPMGRYPAQSNGVHSAPGSQASPNQHVIMLPLYNIRKALSARIVNSFVDTQQDRMAYTIWVYDVETTKEWYAPIRYLEDFEELRLACIGLAPPQAGVAEWDFPSRGNGRLPFFLLGNQNWRHKVSDESPEAMDARCRSLEQFLRGLCGLLYTCQPLSPYASEMAIHVQSFLGVEAGLGVSQWDSPPNDTGLELSSVKSAKSSDSDNSTKQLQEQTRHHLKVSIQRYTYRVFLLNVFKAIVSDFVQATKSNGPKMEELQNLEATAALKNRAHEDLDRIQTFLDHLVDLILDGCASDLEAVSHRQEYQALRPLLHRKDDDSYWERLVREAVREQVEIEVYVPLRSVVSRLLVHGWRHDDMEVQFKMKELRRRPQSAFRIPTKIQSPSDWHSVASILKRGLERSTLPCCKLRAIVAAAEEISALYTREHGAHQVLGADDFLPIFIFCVVRAEMERPCALGILLQTLCDRTNRIGEIGYFLASYEAALAHIQEVDLREVQEEQLSFLSGAMTEVSLDD